MKIAVSFDRDSASEFYQALIRELQTQETAVYGNNLTHFFPNGPKDFVDHTRLDDAIRHPDLIIVLLSREYLKSHWLRSEIDGFLRLESARQEDGLVVIVPTGSIEDSEIPPFYQHSIVASLRLERGDQKELDAIAAYVSEVREARKRVRSNKVFIIHGHDRAAKTELELFLNEIGLEPVVLHRQADQGLTIIEKFEKHSCVDYAVALLTPDDRVAPSDDSGNQGAAEYRARQNVIFELGFFLGKLGRKRVCCIYRRGVTPPSDIAGLIYKEYREHVEDVKWELLKELRSAGYKV
ncbi:MAG TPA: TIR domain-containing protein [Allosphingosinicella sp.]|nr:TIR domain-containing protein [Allosphingosinicella sp.]